MFACFFLPSFSSLIKTCISPSPSHPQPSSFGAPGEPVPGESRQEGSEPAVAASSVPSGGGGGQPNYQQTQFDSSGTSGSFNQSNYSFQYSQQQAQTPDSMNPPSSLPPNATPSSTSAPSLQHTPAPGTSPALPNSTEYKTPLQPKRLHVSNVPFRFREPDLRQLFYVSWCTVQNSLSLAADSSHLTSFCRCEPVGISAAAYSLWDMQTRCVVWRALVLVL